ncbi:MAG: hypothetical protein AABX52_04465 [Nanoarchaeota archaeon]
MSLLVYFYSFLLGSVLLFSPCCIMVFPAMLAQLRGKPILLLRFVVGFAVAVLCVVVLAILGATIMAGVAPFYVYIIAGLMLGLGGLSMLGMVNLPIMPFSFSHDIKSPLFFGFAIGVSSLACAGPAVAGFFGLALLTSGLASQVLLALSFVLGSMMPFLLFSIALSNRVVSGFVQHHRVRIQTANAVVMLFVSAVMVSLGLAGLTR